MAFPGPWWENRVRGRGKPAAFTAGAGRAGNPLLDYPHWEEEARG